MNTVGPSMNVRDTVKRLFRRAKLLWRLSLTVKLLIICGGLASIWTSTALSPYIPIALFGLAICSEISKYYSDHFKSKAEALHRKADMFDSFGWPITAKELADYGGVKAFQQLDNHVVYFESNEPTGPKRALENLEESTWWSEKLSREWWGIWLAIIVVLIITSVGTLLISLQFSLEQKEATDVSKVVTSVLSLLWSCGLIKLCMDFYKFANLSKRLTDKCYDCLNGNDLTEQGAVKLWHEYQLGRASAPLACIASAETKSSERVPSLPRKQINASVVHFAKKLDVS